MIVFNILGFYGLGLALATGWAYGEWASPALCIDLFGQLRAISSSWYAHFFSASGVCLTTPLFSARCVISETLD